MTEGPGPGRLGQGRFEGRAAFAGLVRSALATAAREGWREIVLCDASFEDWPLGEREVQASLNAWARTGRSMTLLARRYDTLRDRHPRFVQWRITWDHIVAARACPSADRLELPSAIWSPVWAMRRLDPDRCTGVSGSEPDRRVALREDIDEWLRRSTPAFPASVLGL